MSSFSFLRWISALVLLLGALPQDLDAQGSTVTVRPPRPRGGIVAGSVVDPDGRPLAQVRVIITQPALQTETDSLGEFIIRDVPPGEHEMRFRKLGYNEAGATLTVRADSVVNLGVVLAPMAQDIDAVVIQSTLLNQVTGYVVDPNGTPIAGAVVEILGLDRKLETNAQGRYVFIDLKPGNYLMQFRARGYRVSQYGLQMLAQMERTITTRLQPASATDRMSIELAATVALEAHRRQSLRGGRSVVVSRDELARFDLAPLAIALAGSSGANALRETSMACVLVNGHEVLTTGSTTNGRTTRSRGVTSINPNGTSGSSITRSSAELGSGSSWLTFFRANEVEMVEIYPEGSENSRTLCARFTAGSGCSCPPEPSGIVIWLRN